MSERQEKPPEPSVIALVRDLLLASRITATANSLGVAVRVIRDPSHLKDVQAEAVFADLNQVGVIEAAAKWQTGGKGRAVVGFVSHVDVATIKRAKAAGISNVMARSKFVDSLSDMLQAHV